MLRYNDLRAVLGESFIALITTNPRNGDEKRIFSFMSCSFILLFCFAMVFYDSVHRYTIHTLAIA